MNEVFSKAYGKYNITLTKDGKGIDFFYSDGKNKLTSVNMASGFEKQLLSVSFRLALSYLQNLGIFVFDEPGMVLIYPTASVSRYFLNISEFGVKFVSFISGPQ